MDIAVEQPSPPKLVKGELVLIYYRVGHVVDPLPASREVRGRLRDPPSEKHAQHRQMGEEKRRVLLESRKERSVTLLQT